MKNDAPAAPPQLNVNEDVVLELIPKLETGEGSVTCAPIALESVLPFPLSAVSVNGPYDVPGDRPDRLYDVVPELIPVTVPYPGATKLYDD